MRKSEPHTDAGLAELGITRRAQLQAFLPAFAVAALLNAAPALAQPAPRRTSPARWIDRQQEIALALAAGQMAPLAWMREVEALAAEVDVAELMALVNRSRISAAQPPNLNDPRKRFVRFLDASGAPRRLAFGAALFDFEPRNVITPHGHRNMASAHLVVDGRFRVRNYDRVRDEGEAMVIRPTRDYLAGVGEVSTMTSARDNIYWFVPQGGRATTFDVILSGLDPGQADYEIRAVDPLGGQVLEDGSIIAPIIDFAASSARYTAAV